MRVRREEVKKRSLLEAYEQFSPISKAVIGQKMGFANGSKEISMLGKTCPHCKERVKKGALVCRYCGRELEPNNECEYNLYYPNWIFAGFAGLAAGAVLALIFGYWKERRKWQEDITDYSVGEEFDNIEF